MFCSKCGSRLNGGGNFCQICGEKITAVTPAPAPTTAELYPEPPIIPDVPVIPEVPADMFSEPEVFEPVYDFPEPPPTPAEEKMRREAEKEKQYFGKPALIFSLIVIGFLSISTGVFAMLYFNAVQIT